MSIPKAAGMLITLVSILLQRGSSIPTTRSRICSFEEPLILNHGDTLQLECGSYCSGSTIDDSSMQFRWSKKVLLNDNIVDLGETTGPVFKLEEVMFRHSGEYRCQCADGGEQCSYKVSVIPVMKFEASDEFIHRGDTFDLSCTLTGYPSNFSRIYSKQSEAKLPHQMQKRLGEDITRTYVPVFEPDGEQYVCEAESYFGGKLVAQFREEITVNVYNPPSIIYTTEYVITNEKEFGQDGKLVCTVQQTPDTNSHVSWFAKGTEITNSSKYSMVTLPSEDNEVVRYQLTVADLQKSDIGSYLCRLSSIYGIEDVQEAWIQVDYRKETETADENGSSHAHVTVDRAFGGPTAGQNNVLFFAFCGTLILVAMVVLWKMSTGQKPRSSKRLSPPLTQYHHGNEDAITPPQSVTRKHC